MLLIPITVITYYCPYFWLLRYRVMLNISSQESVLGGWNSESTYLVWTTQSLGGPRRGSILAFASRMLSKWEAGPAHARVPCPSGIIFPWPHPLHRTVKHCQRALCGGSPMTDKTLRSLVSHLREFVPGGNDARFGHCGRDDDSFVRLPRSEPDIDGTASAHSDTASE